MCFCGSLGADESSITTDNVTRDAYAQPIRPLSEAEQTTFFQGRTLVRQSWVIPPSENRSIAGLGPLYNRISCIACHTGNGRGFAPVHPNEPLRSMLVRLSMPGTGLHGSPAPTSNYGDQLNESGAPGVPGEGRVKVTYKLRQVSFSDGEVITLREPELNFLDLAYGDLPKNVLTSPRIAPPLYGLGLLEAVPEATLAALERAPKPAGIKGHLNRVWDSAQGKLVVGKFGWKANSPNLRQQIASAFVGDMGITSSLFPIENCTEIQASCKSAPSAGNPELTDEQLFQTEFYHLALAVPSGKEKAGVSAPDFQRGAQLFKEAHCAACHVPELKTGHFPRLPALSNRVIRPHSDLLLHDMGDSLADGRPDYLASGREWRTPPLWGIGLAQFIEPKAGFLHDGRARTLVEAILWHGGEAEISMQSFKNMPKSDRDTLIHYLESI